MTKSYHKKREDQLKQMELELERWRELLKNDPKKANQVIEQKIAIMRQNGFPREIIAQANNRLRRGTAVPQDYRAKPSMVQ